MDFLDYSAALRERLAAHDACIWTLGGKASDAGHAAEFTRVTYDFTLALANTVAANAKQRFSFCYLSGMGADPTETARLPWERLTRHVKGRTERALSDLQRQHAQFCVHNFRPGGILPKNTSRLVHWALSPIVVGVDRVASALVRAAIDPALFGRWPVVSNADIKRLG